MNDDESSGMMMEESTVEIEPWEDYLTLEVGPVLKCMQYPSFDEDLSEGGVDQITTEDEDERCSQTNTSYKGDSSSNELDFDIEDDGNIDDSDNLSLALEIEVKSVDSRDEIAVIENSQGPDKLDNELDYNDDAGLNQYPRESYGRTSSGIVSSMINSDVEDKGEQELSGDKEIINDKPNRTQSKVESLIGSAKFIQEDREQPVSPGVINNGDIELCSYTNEIFALEQNDPLPAVDIVEGRIEEQDELESIMTGEVETAVSLGDVNKVEAAIGQPRDNLVLEDAMVTQLELSNEERINFSSDQTGKNIHKSIDSSLSSNKPEEQHNENNGINVQDLIYNVETNDESQVYMKEKYVPSMQEVNTKSDNQITTQGAENVIEHTCSSKGPFNWVTEEDGTGEFRSNKNKDLYLEHQTASKGDQERDQALAERQAKSVVTYKQHENTLQQNQTDILQRQLEHSFPEKDHIYKTNYSRKKNKKVTDLSFPSVAKDKQHKICNFEKKLSYDYEREVSFETDVYGKRQNEKRSQGQFYSRTESNDIYRHNNPHRRERKILNTVPETEIEHSRNIPSTNMTMSVKQHASASRQFQPIERGLSMRIDRDTLGDHNKTYVHMAGSSNYAKRHHKSQDALANIKSRRMKINRGDSQKRGEKLGELATLMDLFATCCLKFNSNHIKLPSSVLAGLSN